MCTFLCRSVDNITQNRGPADFSSSFHSSGGLFNHEQTTMIHLKQMISTMLDIFLLFYYMIFPTIEDVLATCNFFVCVYGYILQVVMTLLDYYNQRGSRKERTSLFIGSGFYEKYITDDKCFSKI